MPALVDPNRELLSYFRNTIRDGIRVEATDEEIDGLAVHRNVNFGELLFSGFEVAVDAQLARGLSLGGTHTHLTSEDVLDPSTSPIGDVLPAFTVMNLRGRNLTLTLQAAF